jgi:sulfocyanin
VQYVVLAADSDLVVLKLGGKKITKLKQAVPTTTTPARQLPKLAQYKRVGPYEYVKASAKQVVFKLTAGVKGKNAGFNFDGYYGGQANFEVPKGWVVTFEFSNASGVPHSLMLTNTLKSPPTAIVNPLGAPQQVPVANPKVGLKSGQGLDVLSYTTTTNANYYLVCGVVGHLKAGMWDRMTVSSSVKTPKIVVGTPSKKLP